MILKKNKMVSDRTTLIGLCLVEPYAQQPTSLHALAASFHSPVLTAPNTFSTAHTQLFMKPRQAHQSYLRLCTIILCTGKFQPTVTTLQTLFVVHADWYGNMHLSCAVARRPCI